MAKPSAYALACVLALTAGFGSASAQDVQQKAQELKKQNTVPLSPDKSMPDQNATQEPSAKVRGTQGEEVLQNGSLTTNGAPRTSDTVPSLYSDVNAADDKLPIAAHTLKHLTESNKLAIGRDLEEQVKADLSADRTAGKKTVDGGSGVIGSEISTDVALHSLHARPGSVVDRMPEMKGVAYVIAKDRFLLVDADNRMVIGTLAR